MPDVLAVHERHRVTMQRLRAEVTYLAYRTGLRAYCDVHGRLRWAWTHRRCGCRRYALRVGTDRKPAGS